MSMPSDANKSNGDNNNTVAARECQLGVQLSLHNASFEGKV
ncbi:MULTISPECIES: hypothetical protein [Enterobacteriaceae]|nr:MULTISPECIES: hypothetical protein [Enterobacteriaceae]MDR4089953.1 hypothetical protein [Escherichia coli]